MRRMPTFLTVLAVLACGVPSHAQAAPPVSVAVPAPPPPAAAPTVTPAKERLIRQLLEATGTVKLTQQMMDQMFSSMQTSIPDVPASDWARMRARFKSDGLVTLIIPVYAKYYSEEELNGLLAFYQSPLGRKVIATLPQVQRESMTIGQEWGRKQAQEMLTEMERDRKNAQKHAQTKATTM